MGLGFVWDSDWDKDCDSIEIGICLRFDWDSIGIRIGIHKGLRLGFDWEFDWDKDCDSIGIRLRLGS